MYKSNPKDRVNRIFAVFCTLWTIQIVATNLVFMAADVETATLWNRFHLYATLLVLPALVHFALVFPHPGRLGSSRLTIAALYGTAIGILAASTLRIEFFLDAPTLIARTRLFTPTPRPVVLFLFSLGFTISVLTLLLRFTFTDLETTQRRLFFVTFALASYALYNDAGDVWLNSSEAFRESFRGYDETFWKLTLASDAFLMLTFFSLLILLALRTRRGSTRHEAWALAGMGLMAVATGFADPIIQAQIWQGYPSTLFLWRVVAVALIFYAILKYQLFDLHVRLRAGVKYGSMTTVFGAVFFTVQELVKDFGGDALGYFTGLAAAAALVLLFTPLQTVLERFSKRVVPPRSTETYEKFRSMEIYKAALEGALEDHAVSLAESNTLTRLRAELGISEADHALLERDIRQRQGRAAA